MGTASKMFNQVINEGRKNLLETEAKSVCREYGIPTPKFELAKNGTEAAKLADSIGYPVVLKIVSPDVVHKSDVDGVKVNLKNSEDVKAAYEQIIENVKKHCSKARIAGILVQEMAPQSTEVIVGAVKDPQFGPTVMFGLGGIFVEVLKDVTFMIAPVTEDEALEMVRDVKAYPLLTGYRNLPKADINAIANILVNTSKMVTEHEEIKELDLNPIMVYKKGAKVVDARIILE